MQLTDFSVSGLNLFDINWSPNGKYVTAIIRNNTGAEDVYLFEIEKMLKDPSTQPIRLTTDVAMKSGGFCSQFLKLRSPPYIGLFPLKYSHAYLRFYLQQLQRTL